MASSKSNRLFNKLNRSLGAEEEATDAAPPAATKSHAKPAATTKPKRKRMTKKAAPQPAATVAAPPAVDTTAAPAGPPVPVQAPDTPPSRRTEAEKCVLQHVPFAVGAGLIPLPFADLAAIGSLQLKVLRDLSHLYDVPFTKAQAQHIVTSLLGSVGGTAVTWALFSSVTKFLPVIGSLLGATTLPAAAGTITYAIGQLAIDHFEGGGTLETFDLDVAQAAFARKLNEAKSKLATKKSQTTT